MTEEFRQRKLARHDFIIDNVDLLKPYFEGFNGVSSCKIVNFRNKMLEVRKIMSDAGLYKSTISPMSAYWPTGNFMRLNNLL